MVIFKKLIIFKTKFYMQNHHIIKRQNTKHAIKGAGELLSDDADVTIRGSNCSAPSFPSSLTASNT